MPKLKVNSLKKKKNKKLTIVETKSIHTLNLLALI
jgi:hypothetical protein